MLTCTQARTKRTKRCPRTNWWRSPRLRKGSAGGACAVAAWRHPLECGMRHPGRRHLHHHCHLFIENCPRGHNIVVNNVLTRVLLLFLAWDLLKRNYLSQISMAPSTFGMLWTSCPLRPNHKCFKIESVIITSFSGNVRWMKSSSLHQHAAASISVYLHVWIWFLRINSRQCDSFACRLQRLFSENKIQALRLFLGPQIVVQWLIMLTY